MKLKLSVLDQSQVSEGTSSQEALQQTVKLAKMADKEGFSRFWVSEHHDAVSIAGSSPVVLMAHLASVTTRIRVGSGGVMLPHYSAFKVAENFKVLEALFTGRIDAGVGRAPGGMPRATYALHNGKYRDASIFPEQIDDLLMYLHDSMPADHPYAGLKATPITKTAPPVWILGSNPTSAELAAEKGLPYMFAKFINGDDGIEASEIYRSKFKPSVYLQQPAHAVAVFVYCGETDEEAEEMATSMDIAMVYQAQGIPMTGIPSPEKARAYPLSEHERMLVQENRKKMIVGSPENVKNQIEELAKEHGADEVMVVTVAYDFDQKVKSFMLLADAFLR